MLERSEGHRSAHSRSLYRLVGVCQGPDTSLAAIYALEQLADRRVGDDHIFQR